MRRIMSICLMLMCQFALMGQARIGADPDYNPSNPGDPQVPVTKYTLATEVTPQHSGSTNYSSVQRYAEGASVYLSAYANTGYRFVSWMQGDSVVSSSSSFYYTMPAKNVTLTAVFKYNPDSPADPDSLGIYYTLTVEAQPKQGGSFNINTAEVMEGHTKTLYAYTNTGYRFKGWKMGDSIVSTSSTYTYKMGNKDVHFIGIFEYNPSNPANPGKNYWNEATGEVIVDDFTPGDLYSAITAVIGGSGSSYRNKVTKITVAGEMSTNDFGAANNFANCSIVDLSRTYGYTEIPSYAFDYNTSLQHILLPSCVTTIGYRAFYQCSNLAEISCYAETPPTVGSYAFYGVADRVIVHVPYSSVQAYSEAEGWSDFVIESFSVQPTIEDFTFADNLDVTYSGQPYEFPISSVPGMGEIKIRYTDSLGVESVQGPTAIGKYYVSIDVEKGDYFREASFDSIASFTIYVMDDVEWTALQELYRMTKGDNAWKNKWNIDGGIAAAATFHGVAFEKGHVVALDLSNNNLQDSIPTTGMLFPYLRELNISDNKLVGNIGDITISCPQLECLYADRNHLTEVYPMLPAAMEVSLEGQTITEPLIWDKAVSYPTECNDRILPTILSYEHHSQNHINPEWIVYNQEGTYNILMTVNVDNGSIELGETYDVYYGNSGDTLNVLTLTPETSAYSQAKILFRFEQGDADLSGKIDVLDLQSIINFIFREYQYYPFNHTAANVQCKDDEVNVLDVIALVDLLIGDTTSVDTHSMARARMSTSETVAAESYLYWEGNNLILENTEDVAALDIVLQGETTLQWNKALGMTTVCSDGVALQRIIGYSMSGKYIPQGKHVLLTTTEPCEITTALVADRAAKKVEVALKAPVSTEIDAAIHTPVSCRHSDGWLQLCIESAWENLQWEVYAAEGCLLGEGRFSKETEGYINILPVEKHDIVIVVVRSNGEIVLRQKMNVIK